MDTRPTDDAQLLREFAAGRSQSAFRTLVERYQDMVYGTARRRLGNDQAASDVAQNVFSALARKAPWLCARSSVGGWLYKSTLMEAARRQRDDLRRLKRERSYAEEMNIRGTNDHDEDAPQLRELMPVLDDAMSGLSSADREALLLRFFRGLSLRDTGAAMGTSEEAARKRVSRALEKLSGLFKRKGITIPAAVIAVSVLPKVSSYAAPAAFASKVTTAAAALPAHGAVATIYMKALGLSKAHVAAVCIAAAAVPVTLQARKIASLSKENASLSSSLADRQQPAVRATAPQVSPMLTMSPEVPGSKSTTEVAKTAKPGGRHGPHKGEIHEMERRYKREARLNALLEKLELNESQFSAIAAALEKADADRKALWESAGGPGNPPPDKAAQDAIVKAQNDAIAAVITEEQQQAYVEFCAEEAQNRQENFANRLLGEMQGLHLSSDQKDRLFALFWATEAESDPAWAWAQTLQEGQVDKLKEILTAGQFSLWQQRIEAWNRVFRPDKSSGDKPPVSKPAGEKSEEK